MASRHDVTELLGLIDQAEGLLERSALSELEVEVGQTTVLVRAPDARAQAATTMVEAAPLAPADTPETASAQEPRAHLVAAPLTGVFYLSPTPDAEPYVREGGQVNVGQVIGLIEAMKLFNEIKSDVTGTVRRITASDGDLVKAKQPLIEVDPA